MMKLIIEIMLVLKIASINIYLFNFESQQTILNKLLFTNHIHFSSKTKLKVEDHTILYSIKRTNKS